MEGYGCHARARVWWQPQSANGSIEVELEEEGRFEVTFLVGSCNAELLAYSNVRGRVDAHLKATMAADTHTIWLVTDAHV